MRYSGIYDLQPGDRIVSSIFKTGVTRHHAIFLGVLSDGTEWVSENHHVEGVRLIRANEYFVSGKKYRTEKFNGNELQRAAAVNAALNQVGKPYNLFSHNCEHFASYVQTGISESKQVMQLLGLAVLLLIIGVFNTD